MYLGYMWIAEKISAFEGLDGGDAVTHGSMVAWEDEEDRVIGNFLVVRGRIVILSIFF